MSHSYDHGGNIFTVSRGLGVSPDQIVDFSASINPLGMSSMVRKSLICSLDTLVHYPDTNHKDFKQALAKHHSIPTAHFTVANGSTELIYNIPAMLPGEKALIISPSFSEYVRALNQNHWETEHFILTPENNFSIDTVKLAKALEKGFNALFISNPANPSGTLYPKRVIEEIYSLCIAAGTFMVLDEAFMDFCEEASAKRTIVHSDNAIILRSMTKFYGIPGLRLGYAISNATLAERLDSMGGPWSVNTLALAAGTAALQDAQYNQKTLEYVRQERRSFFEELAKFSQFRLYASSTNYILVEIIKGISSRELKECLLPHRILIRDCSSFMGLTVNFFRVAVRTKEENKILLDCLGKIFR
ncbi:MAG: threonine-phosphate decarboxylase CobD [Desulfuromonadaceae bacterium]|nr:threonine-phosphate decarboxylase CobD [Desulfuromonadaceae bacterium]MDD2856201.1 threonine-phosphate decarboxylase CobD [Desulfuromonadaceae bacterium]